jgi:hypothetical protein
MIFQLNKFIYFIYSIYLILKIMKKLMFLVALVSLVFMQSCEKFQFQKKATVEKTVEATLKVNESYTFTLPTDIDDDAFAILTDATNASISRLTPTTYEYTPAVDFVGTEVIVLSNDHEMEAMGGGCGNHGDHDSLDNDHDSLKHPHHPRLGFHPRKKVADHNHYKITINLNIVAADTTNNGKFVK